MNLEGDYHDADGRPICNRTDHQHMAARIDELLREVTQWKEGYAKMMDELPVVRARADAAEAALVQLDRQYKLYKHIAKSIEHAMHDKDLQKIVLEIFDEEVKRREAVETWAVKIRQELEQVAAGEKVYKGHGDYDIEPALTANEAMMTARAVILELDKLLKNAEEADEGEKHSG